MKTKNHWLFIHMQYYYGISRHWKELVIFSTQCVAYAAHVIIPSTMTTLELHYFSHVINDTNRLSTLKHGNVGLGAVCVCVCVSTCTCTCKCLCVLCVLACAWVPGLVECTPIKVLQLLCCMAHDHFHHCPTTYIVLQSCDHQHPSAEDDQLQ